jgi:hypothetical protein
MERAGATVSSVHDSGALRDLVQRRLVATVWANRPQPTPKAISSRIRDLLDEFKDRLAADRLEQIETALGEAFRDATGVVLAVGESGIEFEQRLTEPLRHERVVFGELAALAPVIEHRQQSIPFVVVTMDRRGADFHWTAPGTEGTRSVTGDQTYITKVQAGGWSHKTYQQRAENTWEHTASEIALELEQLVRDTKARVVIVASEERMGELLRNHLSDDVRVLLRDVTGSRTRDGSEESRDDEIARWVRSAVAEDTVAALQLFEQERGQLDRAANGAAATFEALRESRVDTLLIHDDGTQNRTAFYDEGEPGLVALERSTFDDLGRTPVGPARMHDVAIRACLLTGAGIRIVPEHGTVDEGIGAILRW